MSNWVNSVCNDGIYCANGLGTSDTSSPYVSIAAMLIESYALDSAWSVASAISNGLDSPSDLFFLGDDSIVKVCELLSGNIFRTVLMYI